MAQSRHGDNAFLILLSWWLWATMLVVFWLEEVIEPRGVEAGVPIAPWENGLVHEVDLLDLCRSGRPSGSGPFVGGLVVGATIVDQGEGVLVWSLVCCGCWPLSFV